MALALITALGAALRLARLGSVPPGLSQDEAINAWNSWCLLKTGHDMTGQAWPLFDSHAIGDHRTTLLMVALLPVQALFGLAAWTTRLPAAVSGALCIPLIAYVTRRLLGARAALIAALLLACDPWHVFVSRLGLEGGITPFLGLLPLALFVRAGLHGDPRARSSAPWAFAAGLAAGVACFGYWSVRRCSRS